MKYTNFGRIRSARLFAADRHAGQFRKEKSGKHRLPYLVHPTGVAEYLMAMGAEDDLIIAGYLHDLPEDTDVTEEEIIENFGQHVLALVKSVTEPIGKPWQERKDYKITSLREGSLETKMLGAADHCDNLLSLLVALKSENRNTPAEFQQADVWFKFKQPYDRQKWYHQESCKAVFANVPLDKLPPIFGKLMRLVEIIFGEQVITDPKVRRKVRRRQKGRINPYSFKPKKRSKK